MRPAIATYTEKVFGIERRYMLHSVHLFVSCKGFPERSREIQIPLNQLRPDYRRYRSVSPYCYSFLANAAIGLIGMMLLIFASGDWVNACSTIWAALALCLFVGGLFGAIVTSRRFEIAAFDSSDKQLRIVRAGPDVATFDQFVDQLAERIQQS
jgi:hypothetical protein